MNRRDMLEAAVAGAIGLGVGDMSRAATDPASLITKAIPSSGERLPAIGLGTIWYRNAQYPQLKAVIDRLSALGGKLIDTAAAYGESESVVGRALTELKIRDKVFVATKFDSGVATGGGSPAAVSPLPGPPAGVSRAPRDGVGGEASFERSLRQLNTTRLDLFQIHNLNGTDALMPMLLDWKRQGRVRYVGVTTSIHAQHDQLVEVMAKYPLDFVQIDFSIDNRNAARKVLPAALERKVGVLVNLPLGRATLLQRMANRPLPAWAAEFNVTSWPQFLLKYVISQPAVTCAIPGTTKIAHLEDNLLAGRGVLADASMLKRMEEFWSNQGT